MFRVKPIFLLFVVLVSAFSARAQTGDEGKSTSMNNFFGFDGLRPNKPDLLYSQKYLADSTFIFVKEDLSLDFELFKKVLFEYDNQGRLLVENEFENKEDIWKKTTKRILNYNSDGFIEYRVNQAWNVSTATFENRQRTFFYRDYKDLVSQEIEENYQENQWIRNLKREYLYNGQNKVSEEVSFDWSEELLQWKPQLRTLYEYNSNEDVISEVNQVWVDTLSIWVNTSMRNFEYNDEYQLVNLLQSSWNKNLKEWIDQSFQSLSYTALGQVENASFYEAIDADGAADAKESVDATYDENGNLNMTLFKEWNTEQNGWSSYEKHIHFWSQYLIGNLDTSHNDIYCFYANPHTVGLPWYCKSLLSDETYNLSVFDHNGVLHHSQQFKGSDTFRLTKNLNNGLYMIVITGGLTVHTEKVLIRN